MKGLIKANTVDKYLQPIRNQIVDLVETNATVMEFGSGNGDLLFKLSDKILRGTGFDSSESLIDYADKIKDKRLIENLNFEVIDLVKESIPVQKVDYAIASLLFHILPWNFSIELLNKMINISGTTIVCGFSKPENFKQNFLLWLDQRFTRHYPKYKQYKKNGFMEKLIKSIENIEYQCIDTFDPVIKIYKITKHNKLTTQ